MAGLEAQIDIRYENNHLEGKKKKNKAGNKKGQG
jgi:hypothetical protein